MKLMIHRITVGRYRYGKKGTKKYYYMESVETRLHKYSIDGNLEHLVDVANLLMLEFELGQHPKRHFKSIDDGEHVHAYKPPKG
jgi:hypothetical protein